MSRARKPTKILQFTGAFKKNPKRAESRAAEPKTKGPLGSPPAGLDEYEQRAWRIIVDSSPLGVLTAADFAQVHITAGLYAQFLKGSRHPQIIGQLRICLQQLGMTPASRSNVSAADDDQEKTSSLAAI